MSQQIQITGGAKVRDLQDVIIGSSGVLSSLGFDVANGVPKLDSNGKILVSQLPNSVMEYKGTWDASTNTPTLANGTGNQGDVYLCNVAGTVNFGAGPIAFIVGDSAVYSGSIWQRSGGATGSVTSVGLSTNGGAITIGSSPITTSGTITANFNGTNLQYVNGAGNLTTFPTLMTSVGLTMPSAFTVTNSPLTGAGGTLAVTGAGYASQYIRGDGTLADFPSSGGGGSSVSYYLNGGTSQGTIGGVTYYEMSKTADTGTGVDFTKSGDGFIVAFLTDANDPAQLNIPAGNWNYEIYASMSANGGTPQMYAELYKYDGTTFTLISTSSNEILYDGTNLNLYTFGMTVPATTLALTNRLAIKLYATNSGGKTTTVHTQDSHLCQVITTFSTGITALNGLTAQVQYFQTGTSGTDFNISSATATHTFNLPTASAANRGALSSADWTTFNNKQSALTNPVTGTGTTNTLPKFTGSTAIGNSNITDTGSLITLGSNTYISSGSLGIGSTGLTNISLRIDKNITGAVASYGIFQSGTIQSDVTTSAIYNSTSANTAAASFTLSTLTYYQALQSTFGAGSSVTTQIGFNVTNNLIGATNNYGFRGSIPSGTNRFNLYMDGTADNFLSGNTGIGGVAAYISSGPILTSTLTNGGSGYVDGTYTDVATTLVSSTGANALFTIVVSGGIVTSATLTWGGSLYKVNDTITVSNTLLGGTGSGLIITINTVDSSQLTISNANGGDISLFRIDTGLATGDNLGTIKFLNNDASTKASGIEAKIGAFGAGSSGGAYLSFLTRSATAGTSLVEAVRIGSEGSVGIGGAYALTGYSLKVSKPITGAINSFGIASDGTIQSDVTTSVSNFRSSPSTTAASFTLASLYHYTAVNGTLGAGSTITDQFGYWVSSSFTNGTNNYAFYSSLAAGTNRWNLYMNGTANNYMAGSLGIGSTSLTGYNLRISKALTGATVTYGIQQDATIQSDVTSAGLYYTTNAQTQAAAFTLTSLIHYRALQGTIGSTSAVTNQFGFVVDASLIGATNNYGFVGAIASGTNRWNLYMNGTANNYMAGTLLIGNNSDSGLAKLQVTGAISQSSVTSSMLKVNANGVLVSAVAGTDYQAVIGYTPANDSLVVHLAGTETITGAKSFSGTATFSSTLTTTTNLTYSNSGFTLVLQPPTLSANKTITLPNTTGTLALLSDITSAVTSVTATSPLSSSGGLTPNITIAQATTTTSGYLSSTDWNTFNGKMNGQSLTAGKMPFSTGTSSLGDTVLNYNGGFFGFNTAANASYRIDVSGSINVTGTYYINGVAITTGGISGSGTTNYLSKFTGTSTIGNSVIYDNGSSVLIGTTDDGGKLVSYSTAGGTQIKAAGIAPAITFSNTVLSPTIGAVVGAATSTNQFMTGTSAGDMIIACYFTGSIVFGTGSTTIERIRISSGGNLLLGTATDSGYKLDVNGTGRFSGNLQVTTAAQTTFSLISTETSGRTWSFHTAGTTYGSGAGSFVLRNNGTDALVFNSSSAATFSSTLSAGDSKFFNSVQLTDSLGGTCQGFLWTDAANTLKIGTGTVAGGNVKMTITSGGNVQINTSAASLSFYYSTQNVAIQSLNDTTLRIRTLLSGSGALSIESLGTGLVYSNSGLLTSTNPSDSRLKEDIKDISWGLSDILKIRPVSYHWKDDKINQGVQFGFIAQEVQDIMPEAIKEFGEDVKYLGLEKDAIYATLVKAIQEQQKQIEELKLKIK